MRGPLAGELTRLPEVGFVAKGESQAATSAIVTMRTASRRPPVKFNMAIVVTPAGDWPAHPQEIVAIPIVDSLLQSPTRCSIR